MTPRDLLTRHALLDRRLRRLRAGLLMWVALFAMALAAMLLTGCTILDPSPRYRTEWLTVCVVDLQTGESRCSQRQCRVDTEDPTAHGLDCWNKPERPCLDAKGHDRCLTPAARKPEA